MLVRRRSKKRRKDIGEVPCRAEYSRHVRTYDFVHDATENGRKLKIFIIVDDFTHFYPSIEPDKPWQDPYDESFNGKFRDECLNVELFNDISHAKVVIEIWQREYKENQPYSSLGYLTPVEFAAVCNERMSGLSFLGKCGCLNGKRQSLSAVAGTPCPSALSTVRAKENLT